MDDAKVLSYSDGACEDGQSSAYSVCVGRGGTCRSPRTRFSFPKVSPEIENVCLMEGAGQGYNPMIADPTQPVLDFICGPRTTIAVSQCTTDEVVQGQCEAGMECCVPKTI
jgi:hypothetical protein